MPWLQKTKLCAEAMGLVVSLLDGKILPIPAYMQGRAQLCERIYSPANPECRSSIRANLPEHKYCCTTCDSLFPSPQQDLMGMNLQRSVATSGVQLRRGC